MIELYEPQQLVINQARTALIEHRRVLIQAATGFGKTVLAAHMVHSANKKGNTCWFACHRRELVKQSAAAFSIEGVPTSYIANGFNYNPAYLTNVCSIGTLARRIGKYPAPNLMIWDECHHIAAANWANIMEALPETTHIGLSATPTRMDGKGLGDYFDTMVQGPSVKWLIDNGYLSKYKIYAPHVPDLSGCRSRMGDYVSSDVAGVMDRPTIVGDAVTHYRKLANGLRFVIFAHSVEASKSAAAAFTAAGIPCHHIDGSMKQDERDRLQADYVAGKVMGMSNVELFTEGYDVPGAVIQCVILIRPTQSLSLYLQMVGRALRPSDQEHHIILDHAGNALRHGLPDADQYWALDSARIKSHSTDSMCPVRQCEICFHVHTPSPQCPACGVFYDTTSRGIAEKEGELQELSELESKRAAKQAQGTAKTLSELTEVGRQRGYKNPAFWASRVLNGRRK